MTNLLLVPPIAFVIYLVLGTLLSRVGRTLSGPAHATPLKSSTYASGEIAPTRGASPGYRPFLTMALFFAVLHLGVLMLGSGSLTPIAGAYLIGLILALVALILG
jgi:NADH:ubiquinone oxidoreductase subunit 3 (subunit A)